jgi:hypothetical protein
MKEEKALLGWSDYAILQMSCLLGSQGAIGQK